MWQADTDSRHATANLPRILLTFNELVIKAFSLTVLVSFMFAAKITKNNNAATKKRNK